MATKKQIPTILKNELSPIKGPRCKICASPIRVSIDRFAAAGYSSNAIAQEVVGKDPNLSTNVESLRRNISRHVNSHLKLKQKSIRSILENRAKQQGILMEDAEAVFVDERGLLDILIHKGIEKASNENYDPYMKDALEAVKIKKELEASQFSEQIKVMEKQVYAITQAVKDIVPEYLFVEISVRARELFEGDIIDLPYVKEEPKELVIGEEDARPVN